MFPHMTLPSTVEPFARRPWITEPGESLLLSESALRDIERNVAVRAELGLELREVVMSRMCTVPLPTPDRPRTPGNAPWPGITADTMWNPLVWLPERLRTRMYVPNRSDIDGYSFEDDDEFAARVAMELNASGLYDQETGTWLDVMSLLQIDLNIAADAARVDRWLAGDGDFDLDTLDLTEHVTVPEQPDWAVQVVGELIDDLIPAARVSAAADMRDAVEEQFPAGRLPGTADSTGASFALHLTCVTGVYAFGGLSADEADVWRGVAARASAARTPATLEGIAAQVGDRLAEIEMREHPSLIRVSDFFVADAA
jgi:hypothetical protein